MFRRYARPALRRIVESLAALWLGGAVLGLIHWAFQPGPVPFGFLALAASVGFLWVAVRPFPQERAAAPEGEAPDHD